MTKLGVEWVLTGPGESTASIEHSPLNGKAMQTRTSIGSVKKNETTTTSTASPSAQIHEWKTHEDKIELDWAAARMLPVGYCWCCFLSQLDIGWSGLDGYFWFKRLNSSVRLPMAGLGRLESEWDSLRSVEVWFDVCYRTLEELLFSSAYESFNRIVLANA